MYSALSYARPRLADHGTARVRTRGMSNQTLENGKMNAPADGAATTNAPGTQSPDTTS